MKKKALKAAFPKTMPVLMGYLFLGLAFGVLLREKGYGWGWALLMSVTIFSGSLQFFATELVVASFQPITAFFMGLLINARYAFYGLSMLEPFRQIDKRKKGYMIFGLTDETYALLCSTKAPEGVDQTWYSFFIVLLDHCYWIMGSLLGNLLGQVLPFSSQGIEFAMTALFLVIFVDQLMVRENRAPGAIGVVLTLICLIALPRDYFLVGAMVGILLSLILLKPVLGGRKQ
ncbi:MAG: branched-chain amino acid ABC transporter permease [Ruminococcaceae bacterium]|nr:branched-chain amino acid ABC transporter permease [Oscillospiraceae bacterium]